VALSPSAPLRVDTWVRTATGSTYRVVQDATGAWWFSGFNVANPTSRPVPEGLWLIEPPIPWPPRLGASLALVARRTLPFDDPRRVTGGGKITSAVVLVCQSATDS
jgi:hypothetical protein